MEVSLFCLTEQPSHQGGKLLKLALIDERMPEKAKRKLTLDGFCLVEMKPSKNISEPIASHPDMILFSDGKHIFTSSEYIDEHPFIFEDIMRLVPGISLFASNEAPAKKYPYDAIFNALKVGNKLFIKTATASKAILDYAEKCNLEIIDTKQGYPACTVLPISNSSCITADKGMAKLLLKNGINVTEIQNGNIQLPPYEYGFIGGAAGRYGDRLYFIGDISRHPDYEKIKTVCTEEKLTPVSLFDGDLLDLGRIIFIECDI